MSIVCTRENLLTSLHATERALGKNPTLPILSHIAIQAQAGKLTLSATDLEVAIVASVAAKVEKDDSWTVPYRIFSGFITSLPEGPVQLRRSGKLLHIKAGSLQGKIQTGSFEDFPIIPKIKKGKTARFNGATIAQAMEDVLGAAAVTETRPELTGVFFQTIGNRLSFAATDTFRLALRVLSYEQPEAFSVIVPQRSAQEIARLFKSNEKVEASFTENQCAFSTEDLLFISRLVEGTFPDFQAIIPRAAKATLTLSREDLVRRLESASFFTSRLNDVKLTAQEEKLNLQAENPDVGDYTTDMIGEHGKGEQQIASFNLRYLLDGLRALRAPLVQFELNGDAKPAVIRPAVDEKTEDLYLLMPIRTA